VKQGLILEEEAEGSAYINEIDVRKPFVASLLIYYMKRT
jgi:hypothetical protein